MVRVFISNISNLPDALDNQEMMEGLPDERKEKIKRIKIAHGRKQSLGAGLLLKYAQTTLGEGLCYNLSHSGDYVICAASNFSVGCDIEKIKEEIAKAESTRDSAASSLEAAREGIITEFSGPIEDTIILIQDLQ